jgi:NADH-quinone oxidoreductase subunit N
VNLLAHATTVEAPHIDWGALSPLIALTVGACLTLMIGLLRSRAARLGAVPGFAIGTLVATGALAVGQWNRPTDLLENALRIDNLALALTLIFCVTGALAVVLSLRDLAPREAGHAEYYSLLLVAILGMVVLAAASNLVTLFLGFELLSIPLYVLCATHLQREHSLESGLKYLIIGSIGSATLLYGLALLYGATGETDFTGIARAVDAADLDGDPLFVTALALIMAGLAFKASVAPFHQWTPDVYEGAPTPVTGFMAVATKAAAFGVILRLFDVAVIEGAVTWAPALAALAVATIVIGNVGAIGQSSVKRILAYSGVAQAGYMLVGVIVTTQLGVAAVVFYLFAYVVMNLAAFAVIVARERETDRGDDVAALRGLGAEKPLLAWPMTIAMLGLAGIPATMGFFGKINLIRAAVDNDWGWLGVAIVIGSAISLVYYLRVVAAVWMRAPESGTMELAARPLTARPIMAGGSPETDAMGRPERGGDPAGRHAGAPAAGTGDRRSDPEIVAVAVVCAAATVLFGIFPEPLFEVAREAGESFANLI